MEDCVKSFLFLCRVSSVPVMTPQLNTAWWNVYAENPQVFEEILMNPYRIIYWLVVWNMNFIFPYIGNVSIPTDIHIIYIEYTQYFFQRGRLKPPTRSSKSSYLDGWILQDDSRQVPMLGQVVVFGAGGPHLLMLPWWFSMATMAENVKSPTSQKCRWTANTRQAPKSRRFRQFLSTIILHSLGVSHWTPTLKGPILGGMTCLAFRM